MRKPCDAAMFAQIDPAVVHAINTAITNPADPQPVDAVLLKLAGVLAFEAGLMIAGLVATGNAKESDVARLLADVWRISGEGAALRRQPKPEAAAPKSGFDWNAFLEDTLRG